MSKQDCISVPKDKERVVRMFDETCRLQQRDRSDVVLSLMGGYVDKHIHKYIDVHVGDESDCRKKKINGSDGSGF